MLIVDCCYCFPPALPVLVTLFWVRCGPLLATPLLLGPGCAGAQEQQEQGQEQGGPSFQTPSSWLDHGGLSRGMVPHICHWGSLASGQAKVFGQGTVKKQENLKHYF